MDKSKYIMCGSYEKCCTCDNHRFFKYSDNKLKILIIIDIHPIMLFNIHNQILFM